MVTAVAGRAALRFANVGDMCVVDRAWRASHVIIEDLSLDLTPLHIDKHTHIRAHSVTLALRSRSVADV